MDLHKSGEIHSEIFRRFVECFPEFINPKAAIEYWKALHTPLSENEASQLQFGVAEFSVSLRPQFDASIRLLAETLRRQPFNSDMITQARDIAHGIFAIMRRFSGGDYPQDTFDKLFNILYSVEGSSNPKSIFRIGYALEFRPTQMPCFRWYAEPRTAGSDQALDRVSTIAHYLNLGHHWRLADKTVRGLAQNVSLRGIGVNLSPDTVPNLKVYYTMRGCAWSQLQEVWKLNTQDYNVSQLELFHGLILKSRRHLPPNTILLAVILTPCLEPQAPTVKWDVFLPQLHTSEKMLQERILQLFKELEIDASLYLRLWEVIAGTQPPEMFHNVHQYASIDLSPDGKAKVNVYLRSPEQLNEHIPIAMRPRLRYASEHNEMDRIISAVQRGLVNLADARENDYSEMIHRMNFPRAAGFTEDSLCLGAVFQRAIVCKTLAKARFMYDVDNQILQDDLAYLLLQQDPSSGGWKYFPSFAELPPDADDVAQVILAFVEAGYSENHRIFSRILEQIERLIDPVSGKVPTWLVDPAKNDPESQLYRRAIKQWWGEGADSEVVANLAFALWRLDPSRFSEWLPRACDLLSSRQKDGWWESTWYWGRTYGTWIVTRLFVAIRPQDPALVRVVDWWISSQSTDGCWNSLKPSAIESAFGLEAGIELAKVDLLPSGGKLLLRIASWLCDHQADDGGWDATPFIRMDINRAATQRGSAQPKYLSYSSRTITTAFCIQALLNLQSLLKCTNSQ